MKVVLLSLIFSLACFGDYERGSIDMHGGADSYKYEQKNNFNKREMGFSTFLDANASKKVLREEKKKK